MNFRDLNIKPQYDSEDTDNIGKDFIGFILLHSYSYKRAVGFFSSSSLIYTSRGLLSVASHQVVGEEPVIKFIVSPKLTEEDVLAIKKGYKTKERIIEEAMLRSFEEPQFEFEEERLNILCHLIADGAMDIKVALTENDDDLGMFHIKYGIMKDGSGEKIAFTGSLNESQNAFKNNFEGIDVFKSWILSEASRVDNLENKFDDLFDGKSKKVRIYDFPNAVKEKLFTYKRPTFNSHIDELEDKRNALQDIVKEYPRIDKNELATFPYDYQKDAINTWLKHKGRGIFDMATGTGKTYTAYGAMVAMLSRNKYHLATVIIAPYQHLVEQWVEDADKFHINSMIIGYSNPKYRGYKERLKQAVMDFNDGITDYFYFICTYATYKSADIQNILNGLKGPSLFVADEAHNCGSLNMASCLNENFKYRLALSATVERYRDEEGTKRIFDYFGQKCIEYPLERAMQEGKLTQYKYYPIVVYLDEEERQEYIEISKKLAKLMHNNKDGHLDENAEKLAIKRAKLIAGANSKIVALKNIMQKYKNEHYMLVYCGTSKSGSGSDEEIRQIKEVTKLLGNELGIKCRKYTSEEDANERKQIKEEFASGEDLQAIVAIKCLDEGVNIPAIRTAFILASSTNPREYIQRRGRVLRLSRGKHEAVIYDFVCLPIPIEQLFLYDEDTIKTFKSLVKNEINRVEEFGSFAMNSAISNNLVEKIKNEYGLYQFETDDLLERINLMEEL